MFNASADLLEYLGLDSYAVILRESIYKCINEAKVHTPDLGGQASTSDVVDYLSNEVKNRTRLVSH
jgi:isocitrate/isopropylmalate dehydrogenase